MKQCALKSNPLEKSFFETELSNLDTEILKLNLSKPALRALIRLKIYTLLDLSKISRESLINAHGMGPSSIIKINCLLEESIQNY